MLLRKLMPGKRKMTTSKEILERHLTLEQRMTLNERGFFDVVHRSGRTYRVLSAAAIIKCYGGMSDGRVVQMWKPTGLGPGNADVLYISRNVWAKGPRYEIMDEWSMLLALKLHVEITAPSEIVGCTGSVSKEKVDAL